MASDSQNEHCVLRGNVWPQIINSEKKQKKMKLNKWVNNIKV